MFDIYKLNYIVNNEIKKIFVFFGNRKLMDNENLINPNQLYKIEPENPLFKNIFSDEELVNIKKDNIDIEFVEMYIHLDDSIEDIKKKIIELFKQKISFDEIYLFGTQLQNLNSAIIYNKLTNNNKLELSRDQLIHYLINISNKDISDIISKINEKEEFTYKDIQDLRLDKYNLLHICLSHKVSTNDVNYNFIVNPYDCGLYDKNLDVYVEKYLSTLNSNLLLDFGKIENNNIYLVLYSDLHNQISYNELLTSKYIIKLYFPFLYKQSIFSYNDYDLKKEKLLSQNKKLLNAQFYKKMKSIDLFYNLNPSIDIDNIENIKYTKKGLSYINFVINQSSDINIPLENIFKLFTSTKEIPLIRYSAGFKKEDLIRLYSEQLLEDGSKMPYLSKNVIFKVMKYSGIQKKVSFYIETDVCTLWCKIDNSGMIDVSVDIIDIMTIDKVSEIVKEYINPLLIKIQSYIEQSGYNLFLFDNFQDNNIEILDLKYIIQNKMDKKFVIDNYNSCLSYIFNVFSNKIEKGILLKYKRVSNFDSMNEKDELIIKLLNKAYSDSEIINTLQENLQLTEDEAKDTLIKFFGEKQIERNMNQNKKLKVKNCAGFNILVKKEVYSNGIVIEIDDINNIQYLRLISLYIDSLLRIIDNKYNDKYKEDIDTLCKKTVSKIKDEENKNDIISEIEKPLITSSHILESNDDGEEIDELFDLMIDDDDDDDNNTNEKQIDDESSSDDDDIEIGDDIQFGGDDDDDKFVNFPLNNPNYFFQRMYTKDPSLFLKKKDGKFESYSRMCAHNQRRQPVLLTNEEKEKIDKEHPDSYNHAIHYGSDEKNKNWYICPRYWCLKTNTSLSRKEVEEGACGGLDAIIPFHASKVPKGKYIFEFNAPNEHVASDGSYIDHYPGFLKNKNKDGKCIPCCFSKWNSNDQIKKRNECLKDVREDSSSKIKKTELRENYIKGYDKILLEKDRWGFLPLTVQELLNTDNKECELQSNLIKPNHTCLLRKGVENNDKKSFIACFADIYSHYHSKSLNNKVLSIEEMTNKIIQSLTLDKFVSYFNGNLIQIFDNGIYTDINIEKYKNDKVGLEEKHKLFNKIEKDDELFFKKIINAYENFKNYLSNESSSIDHRFLFDIFCFKDKDLIDEELNLVIFEILKDDVTDNVEILCPTNHYSSTFFDKNKNTVFLIKQDVYYEPIYAYKEKSKKNIELTNMFHILSPTILPNIKTFIIYLEKFFKKCKPLPSLPSLYFFKENIPLLELKKQLKQLGKYTINNYVINYNSKVVGLNITFDKKTGYLPCYPSNIPNINSLLKFIDEDNWYNYRETIDFLKTIKNKNSNILCQPKQRVIEDGLIIGINTETNQFIPISEPVEYFDDSDFKKEDNVKGFNQMDADKIILHSDKKDSERENYIRKVRLESLFYNSFRNVIKILINKYENQSYMNEIKNVVFNKDYLFYEEKLKVLIDIIENVVKDHVEFSDYKQEVLEEINTITLCFNECKKPLCLTTQDKNCKFIIPKENLLSGNNNTNLYYSKIADEILRHHRLRDYILGNIKYLSFSKLFYEISENEVILPQSSINKDYFDLLKKKKTIYLDSFVKTNTFDDSLIDNTMLQLYDNKIKYKDVKIDDEDKLKETSKSKTFNIVKNISPEKTKQIKCYDLIDKVKGKKLGENIFIDYKERVYNRQNVCNYHMFKEIFDYNFTNMEIKNNLIELYKNNYIIKYGDKIYNILENEGKNVENLKQNKETIDSHILSDRHFFTLLDILVLADNYKIGVLKFIKTEKNKGKNKILFIKNGEFEKNIILKINAQATMHHNSNQIMPGFSLIVKKDNNIYHNLEQLESDIKKNNYEIEYFNIDDYINNRLEISNLKKEGKIKLNE